MHMTVKTGRKAECHCFQRCEMSFKFSKQVASSEINMPQAPYRYALDCVLNDLSSQSLSLPFPFIYPSPILILCFFLLFPLPLFLSSFLLSPYVCRSSSWPDGGAADQNVPVPWRQSDQCGLEPWRQTLCHWRTEGTVLSMCKCCIHISLSFLFFLWRVMYHFCIQSVLNAWRQEYVSHSICMAVVKHAWVLLLP